MSQPLQILLVEDNPQDAELVLRELRRAGFEPTWQRVDTEEDYLAHLHPGIDIVLSDFSMPEFSGERALELLKASGLDIPFIIVSGTIGEDTAVEAMRLGAWDYLLKDRLARLGFSIEHALEKTQLLKETKGARQQMLLQSRALEAAANAIIITDREGKALWVNRAFYTLTGYTAEEIVGQSPRILKSGKHGPEFYRQLWETVSAGQVWQGEMMNRRKDGSLYSEEMTITPIRAADGEVTHFIAVKQDITARKLASERIRLREQALDQVSQGVIICDEHRLINYANAGFAMLTGYAESEILGLNCSFLQGADSDPETILKMRAALDAGEAFECEILNYRKNGQPFWNELSLAPIQAQPGQTARFIGIQRDITERKRTTEILLDSQQRLLLATESAHIGIWDWDIGPNKMTWDSRMFDLYGIRKQDFSGAVDAWQKGLHPDDRARAEAEIDAALRGTKDFHTEFRVVWPSGEVRTIEAHGLVQRGGDGAAERMIGVNWDVTDDRARNKKLTEALAQERELSEKARAGERAKSEFLAVMSHEVRTPLNSILGFSELLAQTPDLPAESKDYAQTISASGQSLLRILDDVLDFSRLEAGRLKLEKTSFAPREILGGIRVLFAAQAKEKELALDVSIDEGISRNLEGDAGRLRQILLNLVGNALKFTERGSVTLGLRQGTGASNYEFFVKDTGPGIAPEQLDRIFLPFTQADSSISRRFGGSGLGLSISRRLAGVMGGTLEVRSQPGHGSEFILKAPLASTGPLPWAATPVLHAGFASEHPLRILVVEDDRTNLKLILTLIRRLGYEPLAAKDGREAVEIYRTGKPDCVLMDIQMPEMDGIEATEQIRALEKISCPTKPTFISALTANIVQADRQRCFDAGMNSYMNKPVQLAALTAMLAEASDFADAK